MTQNVLVTGGAGYIGSHTSAALAAAGFLPVAYDNLSTGFKELVQFGPLVEGDILDRVALQAAVRAHKPVAIIHFAARLIVPESVAKPELYYETNTGGGLNVARVAAEADIPVIFSSTAAVYGIPDLSHPIGEDAPTAPINPYGSSKLMVEQMLADMDVAHGLKSVSLRYFNAAGASLDGKLGYMGAAPTHLIPSALEAVLGTRPPLQVMGTDYPTPDGTAVRDYIHVDDLASAHVQALRYLLEGGPTLVANLGNGQGSSVKQVIAAVEATLGRPVPHTMAPRRAGDPPLLVADPTRAMTALKWQPTRTLADMIGSAWAWRTR